MIYTLAEHINNICRIDTVMQQAQNKNIVEYYAFMQTWSTTALGFDDSNAFSGQAITDAITTIIKTRDELWYVFFGNSLAYCLKDPSKQFFDDLKNFNMKSCSKAKEIY